jgi:hypothetical protein
VRECKDIACYFYPYRLGIPPEGQPHQPLSAIKTYCFENCQAGAGRDEVLNCKGDHCYEDNTVHGPCPVFPFRFGKNPNISVETREKLRQIALLRDPLALQAGKIFQALARFYAPESHETGLGILHPASYENNAKFACQSAFGSGMEVQS